MRNEDLKKWKSETENLIFHGVLSSLPLIVVVVVVVFMAHTSDCMAVFLKRVCLFYEWVEIILSFVFQESSNAFSFSSSLYVSFRFVEDILAFLGAQCPWLHSMSWQLCARCDLCVGEDEEPEGCSWHHVHSCHHPDCAHFIPLDSQPLRCDKTYKLNSLLTDDKLHPWMKVGQN